MNHTVLQNAENQWLIHLLYWLAMSLPWETCLLAHIVAFLASLGVRGRSESRVIDTILPHYLLTNYPKNISHCVRYFHPGACCFQYFPSDKAMCDLRPWNTRDEYLQNNVSEMSCADCIYSIRQQSVPLTKNSRKQLLPLFSMVNPPSFIERVKQTYF